MRFSKIRSFDIFTRLVIESGANASRLALSGCRVSVRRGCEIPVGSRSTVARMSMQLQTSRVHLDDSAAVFSAVQCVYCLFGASVVRHLNKRKASRLACGPISHDPKPFYSSMFLKYGSNLMFRGVRTEVTDKNIIHPCPSLARPSGTDGEVGRKNS